MINKDLSIYETGDGGDLNVVNGDLELSHTLFNQAYLAMFGGNIEQTTDELSINLEEKFDWWGNTLFDNEHGFNSLTERQLNKLVINGNNLQNLESIIEHDLTYLNPHADISVDVSMEDYNRISLNVKIVEPSGKEQKMRFLWQGVENQFIQEAVVGEVRTRRTLWILAGGYWNDFGIWVDVEKWYDTPPSN